MSVFSSGHKKIKAELRNPNELREAYIYESFKGDKIKANKFATSKEASVMLEEGMISQDLLNRLTVDNNFERDVEITVCQMAKDNNDPEWEALVSARMEERRILDDLLEKYGTLAESNISHLRDKYLNYEMPKDFR